MNDFYYTIYHDFLYNGAKLIYDSNGKKVMIGRCLFWLLDYSDVDSDLFLSQYGLFR